MNPNFFATHPPEKPTEIFMDDYAPPRIISPYPAGRPDMREKWISEVLLDFDSEG